MIYATFLAFLFISCATSPLSPAHRAHSLKKEEIATEFGNVNSNFFTRLDYGLTDDLEVGGVVEFGSIATSGVHGKYSLINKQDGLALAFEAGVSQSASSYYYAGGIIALNFAQRFSFYWNARYVNQELDEGDYEAGDAFGSLEFEEQEVTYLYNAFGMVLMFSENFGLNLFFIRPIGKDVVVNKTPFGLSLVTNI